MLDGQSGQVGIHDEGARDLGLPEEREQDRGMMLARLQQAHARLGKPGFDDLESLFERERIGEHTCVSRDPQKREDSSTTGERARCLRKSARPTAEPACGTDL